MTAPARTCSARAGLTVALVALGWLVMQALHEAGHVLHARASGAAVERVDLHPLRLSRTVVAANPRPRFVAWGGAVWGCLLPLAALLAARALGEDATTLARALAGGCLLANGVYLGTGPWTHAGDAGDLLLAGEAPGALVAFGVVACAGGLWLWHGLGPRLETAARPRVIATLAAAAIVIGALGFALGA
ncbi:MAG: hypothetical protein M9894_25835 [Planctomycetes bacterium]|nr:hypothetical protein [Planctomycetota bacterium]